MSHGHHALTCPRGDERVTEFDKIDGHAACTCGRDARRAPSPEPRSGPVVTHQATEDRGGDIQRSWSRWSDGRTTYLDWEWKTVSVRSSASPFEALSIVSDPVGFSQDGTPPPGLKWIETQVSQQRGDT